MTASSKSTLILLWPFVAVWNLVTFILKMTGRLVLIILGLVTMILGVVVSLTVIGAVVGIPLFVFGFLLVMRGIF